MPASAQDDDRWIDYFQIGAYVEHVPTGLWLYGAYGHIDPDGVTVHCIHRLDGAVCGQLVA